MELQLPEPVQQRARQPFPLVATLAPIALALILFAVTASPLSLVFAAFGPIIAIASLVDGMVATRRERSAAERDRAAAFARIDEEIGRAHRLDRAERSRRAPSAATLSLALASGESMTIDPATIRLGTGPVESAIAVRRSIKPHDELEQSIVSRATVVEAPVIVPIARRFRIVGRGAAALGLARSLVVQLVVRLPPGRTRVSCSVDGFDWLGALPFGPAREASARTIRFERDDEHPIEIELVATAVSGELDAVTIDVSGIGATATIDGRTQRVAVLDVLSAEEARAAGDAAARRLARADASDTVPRSARLELPGPESEPSARLAAGFAIGAHGSVVVDLVNDGPHAVVGGATGAGKSELVTSWLVALAASKSPSAVNFLLVDFKGGATFAPLERLPHTVGSITDLDEVDLDRVISSLRAELRSREARLAELGASTVDAIAVGSIPRLIIAIDEYGTLVDSAPAFHALVSDIAARGRSLGVHLVISTQRPSATVRESALANIALRVSLRVNSRDDSLALVGSDRAAALHGDDRGRAILSSGGRSLEVQVARSTHADLDEVVRRWAGCAPPARPIAPPLPASIARDALPPGRRAGKLAIGLRDEPWLQRVVTASVELGTHAPLAVIGDAGSGRSTALATIAAAAREHDWRLIAPNDEFSLWDTMHEHDDGSADRTLLVIDDLDLKLARLGDEHRLVAAERIALALRAARRADRALVVSWRPLAPQTHAFTRLLASTIALRHRSRHDYIESGGLAELHDPRALPGRGCFDGAAVQVARSTGLSAIRGPGERPAANLSEAEGHLAIVSTRPRELAERARGSGFDVVELSAAPGAGGVEIRRSTGRSALIGDVDAWQSTWGALSSAARSATIVFDRCTVADYRAVTRSRVLPPPLPPGAAWAFVDGAATRTALPF